MCIFLLVSTQYGPKEIIMMAKNITAKQDFNNVRMSKRFCGSGLFWPDGCSVDTMSEYGIEKVILNN